jgi:hypothetical protein
LTTGPKRSIRALAKDWGWHPSRVFRFLERIEAETPSKTPRHESETPSETPDLFRETAEAGKTPEKPEAGRYLTFGPALKSMCGYGDDSYDWRPDNADIVTSGSPALAIYLASACFMQRLYRVLKGPAASAVSAPRRRAMPIPDT